jgi:dipeptidase E
MRLLLISNSTNPGEAYLDYPKKHIEAFLAKDNVREALFVPYAAVTFSYDAYVDKVQQRFDEFGIKIKGIHKENNPVTAVQAAQAIVVGGGNTFHLLKYVQESGITAAVREKVRNGTPYVGWSAGSNMACPTICTTNDMPIVEPENFDAFNLIPFQINPHYLDAHPQGHAGETREQRIEEYIAANPGRYVAGLREGCIFVYEDEMLRLIGDKPLRVFCNGQKPVEVGCEGDFNFLLKQ